MNIYDLNSYDFSQYNYTENSIKAIKKTKKLSILLRRITIILCLLFLLFGLIVFFISSNIKLLYLGILIAVVGKLLEANIYLNMKKNLFRISKMDYHDYEYYYYCKKRTKSAHNMHLLNLAQSNIEMKRYEYALNALQIIDLNTTFIKNNLFSYYYYYARLYKELGFLTEFEEKLSLLNELSKKKRLSKNELKILESLNNK